MNATCERTPEDILQGMLDLFGHGEGWTRRVLARDAEGDCCLPYAENAVQFCLMGAMCRVVGSNSSYYEMGRPAPQDLDHRDQLIMATTLRLERTIGARCVGELVTWNNTREHFGEIQSALRAALEDGK